MVNVTDRQVELCVNVTVPADQNIGGVTFSLTVETRDGTASTYVNCNRLCVEESLH